MRYLGVIPARLESTRLPRKVLRTIAGAPLIAWVYRAARSCPLLEDVIIATDSAEVIELAEANGWRAMMTSRSCASGSDRVFEISKSVESEVYVNIQGDEPLLRVEHIEALLRSFSRTEVMVSTLATRCPMEEIANPNVVKVVTNVNGQALYFSRSAIPFDRDRRHQRQQGDLIYRKHIGFYAYRAAALERFATLPPGPLEQIERLEQLRFLENGVPVHVESTPFDTIGVDTEDDLKAAEKVLNARTQNILNPRY